MLYRVKQLQASDGGTDSIYEKYIMSPTSIKKDQNYDFSDCVGNLKSETVINLGNKSFDSRNVYN